MVFNPRPLSVAPKRFYQDRLSPWNDQDDLRPDQDLRLYEALRARNFLSQLEVRCGCVDPRNKSINQRCDCLSTPQDFIRFVSNLQHPEMHKLIKHLDDNPRTPRDLVKLLDQLPQVAEKLTELHKRHGDDLSEWPKVEFDTAFNMPLADYPLGVEWPIISVLEPAKDSPKSLIGLADAKKTLKLFLTSMREKEAETLAGKYRDVVVGKRLAPDVKMETDPLAAILLGMAASCAIRVFVRDTDRHETYQLTEQSYLGVTEAFPVWAAVSTGKFTPNISLFPHYSPEATLAGTLLLVSEAQIKAIIQVPVSKSSVHSIARRVIEETIDAGQMLVNKDFINLVRKELPNATRRQILAIGKPLFPKDWIKPGPKRNKRRS